MSRSQEQVAAVSNAVDRDDAEAIRLSAHKLKGASQTLGAHLLGTVAGQAEQAARAGQLAVARNHVRELEVVFSLTRGALGDMVEAIGGDPVTTGAPAASGGGGLHALLADDEPVALAVLRATVERLGHDSVAVTDGEAALAAYERDRQPVVITDLRMPGIDGVELARRIRELGGSTYIALLSATGDPEPGALGQTVDAWLTKPLREDELRAVFGLAAQRLS